MAKRSIAAALIALLVSIVFAGCSDYGRDRGGTGGRVRISIMANLHTQEVPSKRIAEALEEMTNAELTIQWVPDGSYDEKINASFSTGTLPRAVYMKNTASLLMFRDSIRNGQFWEIGPLISNYPNLSRLNKQVLENTSVNGKIYGLYQERPLSRQGVIYRKDWADRLGLKEPTTIEELYTMLYKFTYNDPDGNGINDTIGLADRSDLIYGAFKTVSSYFGTPNGWGEQDGRLLPEFMFPEYVETMKFFRKLHAEQLMNKDFPVTGKVDQQQLITSGKAGVYVGSMSDVLHLSEELSDNSPEAELAVQNRIRGPKGYGVWSTPGFGTVVLFPKSSNQTEEDLHEILTFYDRLMSSEATNLIYWGIEGNDYKVDGDRAVLTEDTKMFEREIRPYQALAIGGRSTIPGLLEPQYEDTMKMKSEELYRDNEQMLIDDPTASLNSETNNSHGMRLQEIVNDATYHFILGSIDEIGFQDAVEEWKKRGGSRIIDEFNADYRSANQ
ncbi:extracellular solute-binding protein [Paenibacillus tarimensis]